MLYTQMLLLCGSTIQHSYGWAKPCKQSHRQSVQHESLGHIIKILGWMVFRKYIVFSKTK